MRTRWWLRRCTRVGKDPLLVGRPTIYVDGGRLLIGDRFRLESTCVPSHFAVGPGATLEIGDDVSIATGAAIATYESVRIGSGTRVGPYAIIMDTNFHGDSGDQSLHHDCRPVVIGAGCRIGSRVTIMRGATIGDGAEVLAGSVVSSPVPPGVCVAGARARIVGRAGDPDARWDSPAAQLPELLMEQLALRAPPDLDATPLPPGAWTEAGQQRVTSAIRSQLGIGIDPAATRAVTTFEELARLLRAGRRDAPLPQ